MKCSLLFIVLLFPYLSFSSSEALKDQCREELDKKEIPILCSYMLHKGKNFDKVKWLGQWCQIHEDELKYKEEYSSLRKYLPSKCNSALIKIEDNRLYKSYYLGSKNIEWLE